MSAGCHDQTKGCLHVEADPEAPHVRRGFTPRKRRAKRKSESCRLMKLGGTVARVRGRHPMPKRSIDALVRAVLDLR